MDDKLDMIQAIRDRQLRWGLRAIAVVGFFALVISILRAVDVGWQNVMALHIGIYLVIIATIIWERRLSFSFRAWILIGVIFAKGPAGLITWGLTGMGINAFVMGCIICTIAFGVRAGVISTLISTLCVGMVWLAFHLHYLSLKIDPVLYLNSVGAWATGVITIVLSAGLVVVVLGSMNNQLLALIQALKKSNDELQRTNGRLESEFRERERLSIEKMELQTKLQRAEKMEIVANVAGGVAHDLNNVLAGAVSYPDLISSQLPSDSPLIALLEKVKQSGFKAAAIVSDLLTLVRRGVVVKTITNLNLIISEYLNSPEFEKMKSYHPQVEVLSLLSDDLWNIDASPVHIMKAVMNLISNGAEAISGSGTLTVSTRNLVITEPIDGYEGQIPPGSYVVLDIADTGIGMSPEDLEKVFDPFYSKKVLGKSGTGLGMTVVWGAVKDHEGYIEIQSVHGKGTRFRLYFPANQGKIADLDTALHFEDYKGNGESILVIDDVVEQRDVAVALLTALGYTAIAVPNGEAALKYLQRHPVDLVVLDMIMDPGMDGLDTYKEIVKLYPCQKAIIATGYCETERVREAQDLGSGNCLFKPFTLEKLGKTVRSELQSSRPSLDRLH